MSIFTEQLKRMSEKAAEKKVEKKVAPLLRETVIAPEFAQALDGLSSLPFIVSAIRSLGSKP